MPSTITRVMKSRRIRWARHVARMGQRTVHTRFWLDTLRKGDHLEKLDVDNIKVDLPEEG